MIKARTKERNFGPSPSFTPGLMAFKLRFSLLYDPLLTSTLPAEVFFVNHLPAYRAWQWSVFSCWISWLHFCVLRNLQIKQDRLKKDRALIRRLYCRLIICRLVVWTSDSFQNFRLLDLAFGSLTEYFWYRAWISGIVRVPTKRWRQTVEFFTGHDILTRSLHPRSTKAATWITETGITLLAFHLRVYVMFIQSMSDHCESNKRIFFFFFFFFFPRNAEPPFWRNGRVSRWDRGVLMGLARLRLPCNAKWLFSEWWLCSARWDGRDRRVQMSLSRLCL